MGALEFLLTFKHFFLTLMLIYFLLTILSSTNFVLCPFHPESIIADV